MSQPASQPATHSRLPSELWQKVFKVILTDLDSPTSRAYKALATVSGINTNARNAVRGMEENEKLTSKSADRIAFETAVSGALSNWNKSSTMINTTYEHGTYRLTFEISRQNSATFKTLTVQHRHPQEPNIDILYPDTEFPASVPDPVKCEYSRRAPLKSDIQQALDKILDRSIWFVNLVSGHLVSKGKNVKNNEFAKNFNIRMCELSILKKAP